MLELLLVVALILPSSVARAMSLVAALVLPSWLGSFQLKYQLTVLLIFNGPERKPLNH